MVVRRNVMGKEEKEENGDLERAVKLTFSIQHLNLVVLTFIGGIIKLKCSILQLVTIKSLIQYVI